MNISSNFDSGNIIVNKIDGFSAQLNIRKDTNSAFSQWFHFRVDGVFGEHCTFSITDAGETSYPDGWEDYHVCASYDRKYWFRVPSTYENGVLSFELESECDAVFFAYFAPYSFEQHLDLVHEAQCDPKCSLEVIGKTVEQRDMHLLKIESDDVCEKKNIWLIARQHPGESMAEWFMEGVIGRLLDDDDAVARKLLKTCRFYLIPNMNPDGAIAGNLRSNAAGANLNREWASPSLEKSPEVYHTLAAMRKYGLDMLLDVHGDEAIPYNFVAGSEGIPSYNEELHQLEEKFKAVWMSTCPDFQDTYNYGRDEPGKANMGVCTNQIAEQFGCLAYTIEMPFKDNHLDPDPEQGWSAEKSVALGESVLLAVLGFDSNLSADSN